MENVIYSVTALISASVACIAFPALFNRNTGKMVTLIILLSALYLQALIKYYSEVL